MGTDYWEPLLAFMTERMTAAGTLSDEDAAQILFTDDPDQAMRWIAERAEKLLAAHRPLRPWRLLGERGHAAR